MIRSALPAAIVCIMVVNPFAVARSVNAGNTYPDHKGAAIFMQSIALQPGDRVIAEEVLMQTYYLGHVDYWLQAPSFAAAFVVRVNGKFVDEYTHTPVIGTGAEFRRLLEQPDRGALYVVGSGENQEDGRRAMRGAEVDDLLRSDAFKVIYVARDGLTTIWKADPPTSMISTR
jgi:hypothetical protein